VADRGEGSKVLDPGGSRRQALRSPPARHNAELKGNVLHVVGSTEPGARLTLDGQRLEVQTDGSFNEFVAFGGSAGTTVAIKAAGVGGGTTEQRRRVTVAN
jgi:hypothetical protein